MTDLATPEALRTFVNHGLDDRFSPVAKYLLAAADRIEALDRVVADLRDALARQVESSNETIADLRAKLAAAEADRDGRIDARPTCVICGRRWMPDEGVDATTEHCGECESGEPERGSRMWRCELELGKARSERDAALARLREAEHLIGVAAHFLEPDEAGKLREFLAAHRDGGK